MPKRPLINLALLFVIIFFIFTNYIFLKNAPNPIGKDSVCHLTAAVKMFKEFKLKEFLIDPFTVYNDIILVRNNYPPLFCVTAALIRYIFNIDFMLMTSTFFFILLLFSTYKIAEIMQNKMAALLSVVIISFYPIIYLNSRFFNLDMAQAAMVSLSLYLLIRTEYFMNWRYSIMFGFSSGFGMLSKHMFILFIIGPVFITIVHSLNNSKYFRIKLKNMVIAFFIFGLVAFLFFYIRLLKPNYFKAFLIESTIYMGGEVLRGAPRFGIDNILFYFRAIPAFQIGFFNVALFIFSIPVFFKKKYQRFHLFFLSWIIFPLLMLTAKTGKYNEYTMPYLAALAIITSLGLSSINNRFIRLNVIILMLIFNLSIFIKFSFPKYADYFKPLNIFDTTFKPLRAEYTPASDYSPYRSKESDIGYKTLKLINELAKDRDVKIGFVNYFNTNTWPNVQLKTLLWLYGYSYIMEDICFSFCDRAQELCSFDFFIFDAAPNSSEQWINKDYFIKDVERYNEERIKCKLDPYSYCDTSEQPLRDTIPIFLAEVKKVINYFPKLKLINRINYNPGDILIYQNMEKCK
jgi:hypothetical protein